jgi:hypothetical protein
VNPERLHFFNRETGRVIGAPSLEVPAPTST